jgi:hypothetical protein
MKINKLILFFLISGVLGLQTCKKVEKEMLVSTGTVSNILSKSADISGEILDLGEGATQYGHCYSTSPGPTVSGLKKEYSSPTLKVYTSNITGLTGGTKYYIRAYLSRGNDVVYGEEIDFTTASAALPEVTTGDLSSVTKTSAICSGTVVSEGGTPILARGICWNISTNPTISNSKTSEGTTTGNFASTLSPLLAGTKYYVRAYTTNDGGTAYGNEIFFTTNSENPGFPEVITANVSSVTTNSASCGGNVANDGGSNVSQKGVCWSTNPNPTISNYKTTDGSGLGVYTSTLTSMVPGTLYYVRAYATNNSGTSYGYEYSFTTDPVVPSIITVPITSITLTTASSGGAVTNTGGAPVLGKGICWSTSPSPTTSNFFTNNGVGIDAFVSSMTNLSMGTKYYVRSYAVNSAGTGYGNEIDFTTLCPNPSAATSAATSIADLSAVLNGTANASNFSTDVTFEYGKTTGYGSSIAASQSPVTGSNTTVVNVTLTGLNSNTTYHYRTVAANCGGTVTGTDQMFTTTCTLPSAITGTASAITSNSATISGTVNANNAASIVIFRYGADETCSSQITATQSPVSGSSGTIVSALLTGLDFHRTYYFKVEATNCAGTATGTTDSFITPCAATLTKSHLVEEGAPEDRTITYGILQGTIAGPDQCWITQNLGADNQAAAYNDASNSAAGWYWQFAVNQGYKWDGSVRTPSTGWISSVNGSDQWPYGNDPCALLLGEGWRVPGYTEFMAITAGFSNNVALFTSPLKIHAAGYLNYYDGINNNRGYITRYWSRDPGGGPYAFGLYSTHTSLLVDPNNYAANGCSLRCVKD